MRKKKLVLFSLACLAGLSLASCSSNNIANGKPLAADEGTGSTTEDFPEINMQKPNTDSEFSLERMILDTSNTKLVYYLGDKIDLSGLKASCTFIRYQPSFKRETRDVTGYYYDTSNIDMSTTGEKVIEIFYRSGVRVASAFVTITVKSSVLETAGIEYAAGLECSKDVEVFLLNDKFIKPSSLTLKVHKFTGTTETSTKTLATRNLIIDSPFEEGQVLDEVGDYMYKISYTENLTVDGQPYENTVTTYIIIRVKNDVTAIEVVSGTKNLYASVKGLDYSDWKIRVTRERGEPVVEDYDPKAFSIRDVDSLIEGDYTATIEHLESGKLTQTAVKVLPSITENIVIGNMFQDTMGTADENGIVQLDEDGVFFTLNATKFEAKAAAYDTLAFDTRISVKGNGAFGINMASAGTICIYIASSGDEIRDIEFKNSKGEALETLFTAGTKQLIKKYVVEVSEGGTYYFCVPANGYIHGAIISTNK